jgi:hypothetical protein
MEDQKQLLEQVKQEFENRIKQNETDILVVKSCVTYLDSIINHLSQVYQNTYSDEKNKERKINDSEIHYINEVINTTINFLANEHQQKQVDIHRFEGKILQSEDAIRLLDKQIETFALSASYRERVEKIDKENRAKKTTKKVTKKSTKTISKK